MKKYIKSTIALADYTIYRVFSPIKIDKNSLIIFMIHGLLKNEKESRLNVIYPESQRNLTIDHLRCMVEYFVDNHYTFVSPNDIISGLNNNRKYIMITFDDGYFNNSYALPILKEYKVPAVFFTATNNITQYKCFWWDVLYRERIKSGVSKKAIAQEITILKKNKSYKIEQYIIEKFGEKAFRPISDVDRPFTVSELKDFSKEKYVFIGNHTSDHAILSNYSFNEIKSQIFDAQDTIFEITGNRPEIIAYPSGIYSKKVIGISKEAGLKLGITIDPGKNYLPIDIRNDQSMYLKRFSLNAKNDLIRQCQLARSDFVIYNFIRKLLR